MKGEFVIRSKKEWFKGSLKRRYVKNTGRRLSVMPNLTAPGVVKESAMMNIKRKTLNISTVLWEKLHLLQEFEQSQTLNDILEKIINEKLEKDNLSAYFNFRVNMRKATDEEEQKIARKLKRLSPKGLKIIER